MAGITNYHIYQEEWATKLQEQLDEPNKFKDICEVNYTNTRVFNNPYHTDPVVQFGQAGTTYTFSAVNQTNESVTINQFRIVPQVIDRAALAESTYADQMELARRQGVVLNEAIESSVYSQHASLTDFGVGDITGGTVADSTAITVSASNIDDICRHVKRVIRKANGENLLSRNGAYIVWRPEDFEMLEGFMMANGYVTSDRALTDGAVPGINYMGITHYSSNLLTTGHVQGGVKKAPYLAILKETYGQIMVDEKDPQGISGVAIVSRVDYAPKIWTNLKPVCLDINVA